MRIAQRLYEGVDIGGETVGLITYMRTDGVQIAPRGDRPDRGRLIETKYGQSYLPEQPRVYTSKAKNAQEAHEAIRPTDLSRTPEDVAALSRQATSAALRADLEAHRGEPDGKSAVLDQVTVDIAERRQDRAAARHRLGRRLRRLPQALPTRARDDRAAPTDEREANRHPAATSREDEALERRDVTARAALHPAAAALLRGEPGQEAGGARHRPALDLCLASSQVLQDRNYVKLDKQRFIPEDRGRSSPPSCRPSSSATSNTTSPPISRKSSTTSPAARSTGAQVLRDFWEDFRRGRRRDQGPARSAT